MCSSGDWTGLTVAVTGACGGYGAFLVRDLVKAGATVRALDLRRDDHLGFMEEAEVAGKVKFFRMDLCASDTAPLKAVMQGVQVVVHTVAYFGDPAFTSNRFANPGHEAKMRAINVTSVERLLDVCQECGVKAFVHTSSFNTIFTGRKEVVYASEDTPYPDPKDCIDLYSVTKAEGEQAVIAASGKRGMNTVAVRPNGIYGPSLRCYAIVKMLGAVAPIKGFYFRFMDANGKDVVADWCHVDNLALIQMLAAKQLLAGNPSVCGSIYAASDDVIGTVGDFTKGIIQDLDWPVVPVVPLPACLLQSAAYCLEAGAYYVRTITGWRGVTAPGLNIVEAAKSTFTNSQSVEKAKRDLGYKPIPQSELMKGMAKFASQWAKGKDVAIPSAPGALWGAIIAGMSLTTYLSFTSVQRHGGAPWQLTRRLFSCVPGVAVMSLESFQRRVLRVGIFVPMVGVHVLDAIYAAYLAKRRGHLLWLEYGLRTLVLGFGQLSHLLDSDAAVPLYGAFTAAAFAAAAATASKMK